MIWPEMIFLIFVTFDVISDYIIFLDLGIFRQVPFNNGLKIWVEEKGMRGYWNSWDYLSKREILVRIGGWSVLVHQKFPNMTKYNATQNSLNAIYMVAIQPWLFIVMI